MIERLLIVSYNTVSSSVKVIDDRRALDKYSGGFFIDGWASEECMGQYNEGMMFLVYVRHPTL